LGDYARPFPNQQLFSEIDIAIVNIGSAELQSQEMQGCRALFDRPDRWTEANAFSKRNTIF